MKVFAVLCLASLALASPQGYSSQGFSGLGLAAQGFGAQGLSAQGYGDQALSAQAFGAQGYGAQQAYSAPTVVSERTYTIKPQLQSEQAAPLAGAYYGGAALSADAGYGANYAGDYSRALGYSAAAAPVYQAIQVAAAPVYQAAAAPAYEAAAAPESYNVNFGVNSGRSINLASGYAAGFNGYSGASETYDQPQPQPQAETKIYKHVYAFSGPEEPSQRAKVVFNAPVSNSKHYKLVFIKAPTSGAVVDSDITLPAQQEEKTQIYVLSKHQQHQPTIRIHTAQAAKHNKPEVLFVKYRNEAEAQAIASGAISGQASGIPAGGQIVSDGSVSTGAAPAGNYYGNSGYSGASFGSGVSLGALATGRSGFGSASGLSSASGLGSASGFGSASGLSSASGFGSGSGFSSGSGSGVTRFSFGTASGLGNAAAARPYSGSF